MRMLRKKTYDPEINQLIHQALENGIELSWDRFEKQQPQCGFSLLGSCCSECIQGPCRISPFNDRVKSGICGKKLQDFIIASLADSIEEFASWNLGILLDTLRYLEANPRKGKEAKTGSGTTVESASLWGEIKTSLIDLPLKAVRLKKNGFSLPTGERLQKLLTLSKDCLRIAQLAGIVHNSLITVHGDEASVGLASLMPNKANVLMVGDFPYGFLKETSSMSVDKVEFHSLCNSLYEPGINNMLGNYLSQEPLLISGLIDTVVLGSGCVQPSLVTLCNRLDIPVYDLQVLADSDRNLKSIVNSALSHRGKQKRSLKLSSPNRRGKKEEWLSPEFLENLTESVNKGKAKGIHLVAGCNNIRLGQDGLILKLVDKLLEEDILIITTGCAGVALAKAGYCGKDSNVFYMGNCLDTAGSIKLISDFKKELDSKMITASFPELSQKRNLTYILGLIDLGIPVYVGSPLMMDYNFTSLLKIQARENGGEFWVAEDATESLEIVEQILRRVTV